MGFSHDVCSWLVSYPAGTICAGSALSPNLHPLQPQRHGTCLRKSYRRRTRRLTRRLRQAGSGAALAGGLHLALACLYPPGTGWGNVRPSGRGPGHVPRLARRGALRDRAGIPSCSPPPAATRKSRIPSGPYMTGAAAAVILASPDRL